MGIKGITLGTALAFGMVAAVAPAGATTIDFSTYAYGTPITTIGDATFSLQGGDGGETPVAGPPVTGSFEFPALGNSPTGDYPTAQILDIAFAKPVSDFSFVYNNFSENDTSTATAYNAAGAIVGSMNVGGPDFAYSFAPGSIAGSGITDVKFDNGSGGNSDWEFGLQQISYTASSAVSAAPEPDTWMMMILGFGLVGGVMRSDYRKSEENFTRKVRSLATA